MIEITGTDQESVEQFLARMFLAPEFDMRGRRSSEIAFCDPSTVGDDTGEGQLRDTRD